MYKTARCRETLKGLEVNNANLKFAANKRASILHEIATGNFDYLAHFPDSKKGLQLTGNRVTMRSVEQAVEHWLLVKKSATANSTHSNYRSKAMTHIVPVFGQLQIDVITKSDLERWIALDLHELCNKTINEILIIWRGVFKNALADGLISESPAAHIDNLPVLKNEPDPFTRQEIDNILNVDTSREQEVLMMQFAIWTGVRISELIALGWDDVDLNRGVIKVRRANVKSYYKVPKTNGSVREVELLKPAIDALKKQKQYSYNLNMIEIEVTQADNKTIRKEQWRPVWRNSNTGKPHASDGTVRDRFWSNHLRKAEVRYRGPNHARHTFASQLLSTGVISKDWIAKQMGHTSTKMLDEHYAKWISEDAPPMAMLVNKVFGFVEDNEVKNAPDEPQNKKAGF